MSFDPNKEPAVTDVLQSLAVCFVIDPNAMRSRSIDAAFEMCSSVNEDDGLHGVNYFVRHRFSKMVWSWSATPGAAIEEATARLAYFTTEEVQERVAQFHAELAQRFAELNVGPEVPPDVAPPPKPIPRRRTQIFEKSNGRCHYCATALTLDGKWHIEHRMPRALDGGNAPDNLVAACVSCNMKKRDRTDIEFLQETARRGDTAHARLAQIERGGMAA